MLGTSFIRQVGDPFKILCLGAHSDDIEIGCGGTILRLLHEIPHAQVRWVVLSASGPRRNEATESADLFLTNAGRKEITLGEFRDGFFPYTGAEIKEFFESLKSEPAPHLIFTHHRNDLHQDHRIVSELTWNTFRDQLILEYEIAKYDADLGSPNYFVRLNEPTCQAKIQYILKCFRSQADKQWFAADTFMAMLRLRGIECNAPDKYAEAFYCRKLFY